MAKAQHPGGLWNPTAQTFARHQLAKVIHFWQQGRPAVFYLKSLDNGEAELNLTFQLPKPSEIIPQPLPTIPTSTATALPPKRPIIPLFPHGEVPSSQPPQKLSSKQRNSYQRLVLHRAATAAPNLPSHPQAVSNLPPLLQAAHNLTHRHALL